MGIEGNRCGLALLVSLCAVSCAGIRDGQQYGANFASVQSIGGLGATHDECSADDRGEEPATLLEDDWLAIRGNSLKFTDEFLNPSRAVPNGEQIRWSLIDEFTPIQFAQIHAGFRWNDGIPKNPSEQQRLCFIELPGYF